MRLPVIPKMHNCIVLGRAMLGHAEGGDPMSKLILYDEVCAAIDRAYQIDEIKDISDNAGVVGIGARAMDRAVCMARGNPAEGDAP
jgi:hypothetical protein